MGSGLANYTISYASGSLTVTPAALNVTARDLSKIYGSTVSFDKTEIDASGLLNGDTVTNVTLSSTGISAAADVVGWM